MKLLNLEFQIAKRLANIEIEGHFGIHREDLGKGICELKWENGRRIYYAHIPEKQILLLLGGNKNGQDKDIKKAKKIFFQYLEIEEKSEKHTKKTRNEKSQ